MTQQEYADERRRLIDTRKKINEARKDLDVARQLSLFPSKVNQTVTISPKQTIAGWQRSLLAGHPYDIYPTNIRLSIGGKTVRIDFYCTIQKTKYTWYNVNASFLEIVSKCK